jgi:cytosine/adenosine deaminase-related metal-dependent hydrolase
MLRSGITSVVDHFSQRPYQELSGIEAVIQAFSDSGMRAVIAPMFSDKSFFKTVPLDPGELPEHLIGKPPKAPQTPESFIDICEQAIQRWQDAHNRLKITLGTDGPQRCSEKLLQLTADLEEKYHVGWHTHTLEAKTQAIMSEKLYGKGLVEYLADLDILNERSTFVHSVWLNEREMDLLAEKRATVVHCPLSNLHLGSGLAPVPQLLNKQVDIALGTDGGNLGNLSIFENMRMAARLQRLSTVDYQQWLTASGILKVMYHGGAKAMFMNGEIGILQEGMRADLILLKTNSSFWQPVNDLTNQVVFYENGQAIDTVIVEGKILLKDGQFVSIDEKTIIQEAREIAARLQRDNRIAFERVQQQIPYFRKMYLRVMQQNVCMKRNMIS